MTRRVLAIGAGSFICKAFVQAVPAGWAVTGVSHDQWAAEALNTFETVINFALDPAMRHGDYDANKDIDLAIARACAKAETHFVMLSSRKVYGLTDGSPSTEDSPLAPADAYGRNKLRSEDAVRDVLGDRATILRLSNVFGFEPGRTSFFGIAGKGLVEDGQITLDVSPFVARDFLSVEDCAVMIWQVVAARAFGVFNLGRGNAVAIGQIALWLIEGFGAGRLVVSSPREYDPFVLDIFRFQERCGPFRHSSLREQCIKIGARLQSTCLF